MYTAETRPVGIEEPVKVLLVEDDPGDAKLVRLALAESAHPYEVEVVERVSTALERMDDSVFDVVLLDMRLPDSQGIDTVSKVHAECPNIPIVVLTGLDDEDTGVHALRIGAQDYLVKGDIPFNVLTRAIRYAIDRKHTEEALRATNQELESTNRQLEKAIERANRMALEAEIAYIELNQIFNAAADGMVVVDKHFNVLRVNETSVSLLGVGKDEATGKKCYEVFGSILCHTPECPLTRIVGGEERIEYEIVKERNDGQKIPCIVTATAFRVPGGDLIGIVEHFKDITERKRMRQERLKKERLKGVLEMAGGICHELNQPMQAISGYSELLMMDTSDDNPLYADINEIKGQIDKMAEITKRLGRITRYKTRDYIGGTKIIDIDKASRGVK